MGTLHLTNGDSAIAPLRAGGTDGPIVPWRDVLHDGPVPAVPWDELRAVRARYIASLGWGAEAEVLDSFRARDGALFEALALGHEVVLWFEHDLYDQLQVVQILAMAAWAVRHGAPVFLAQADDYIGTMSADAARGLAGRRRRVGEAEVALAERAWQAFTAPSPGALRQLAMDAVGGGRVDGDAVDRDAADAGAGSVDFAPLPFLRPALVRLLEELPDAHTGLSRTEMQALHAIAAGAETLASAYRAAHHDAESPIWLGDSSFARYVARLAGPDGLIAIADGRLRLTPRGDAVLAGAPEAAWQPPERWLGGTHVR